MIKPLIPKSKMNTTEARYADRLKLLLCAGEILDWKFEGIKFRLADNTYYTPDFFVTCPDHFEVHEIKGGYIYEDSIQKFKIAAEEFPRFKWLMIQWKDKHWKTIRELGGQ